MFVALHQNLMTMRFHFITTSNSCNILSRWRDDKTKSLSFSLWAEAWPQAVQCLINFHRLDGGRRQNLQRIWPLLCETSNPAPDPIVQSLLIVDLTFCWDILLKDTAGPDRPDKEDFPPGKLWAVSGRCCCCCWCCCHVSDLLLIKTPVWKGSTERLVVVFSFCIFG